MTTKRNGCHHDDHDHVHHDGILGNPLTRRTLLRRTGAAGGALLVSNLGLAQLAIGQTGTKTLVKVFMRGGADGLNICVPYTDSNYYRRRSAIAVPAPLSSDPNAALRLNSKYGLNPNLVALMEIWESGRMAFANGVHFDEGNRSHFDCQQWIEFGSTNLALEGLFNRYLQQVPGSDPFRALTAGRSSQSPSLSGRITVPAVPNASNYRVENSDWCSGTGCADNQLTAQIMAIGRNKIGSPLEQELRRVDELMVETFATVRRVSTGYVTDASGLEYSGSSLGQGLRLVAQLLKGGVPVEVATADWPGPWDTHERQIGASIIDQDNPNARTMVQGARDLVTFWRDIRDYRDRVVVVVGSEFGRNVTQNGSTGTDHGRGGTWFAFGGPTSGGVFTDLPPLTDANTPQNVVPNLFNYKDLLAEVMVRHMGIPQAVLPTLFPGHTINPRGMFARTA